MKKNFLIVMILIVSSFFAFAEGQNEINLNESQATDSSVLYGAKGAEASDEFSLEEMMKYAIEDERLALAEYAFIMDEYNVSRPFSNIINAEAQHESALLGLYEKYGFDIPDFVGSEHVVLPSSLEEIYDIGVEAEIANIAMYEKFLTYDLDSDVKKVFTALRDGSVKHLTAFERQAAKYN